MPPFSGTATAFAAAAGITTKREDSRRIVTLNIGGQIFQTTRQTLTLAGPKSFLSSLPSSTSFIDRDPALFSLLLSLLRTGRLSPSSSFDSDDLLAEAKFYGLEPLLLSALADEARFDPFALHRSLSLPLHGRDPLSAVAAAPSGVVLVAQGGKITSFDRLLRYRSTVLTSLPVIDSLLPFHSLAAAGATDFPGLQILDLNRGSVVKTLTWANHPPSIGSGSGSAGSTVQAIGSSPDFLFGSFESCRRNASAIAAFDLTTLQSVAEIGRQEIYGAELDSGIPATKLKWIPGFNLLMASGSHAGPSGILGNIKLWDVRSGAAAFVLKERADCFADTTACEGLSAIFKVGVDSGDVYTGDLRKLSSEEPWVCLGGDGRRNGGGRREGSGCRIEAHGSQVFCSRGGEVEMWTEVAVGGSAVGRREDGLEGERVMRRNTLGRAKDAGGSKITQMVFGGNRMVLARTDQQCVEIWESSSRG